ncbi:9933_t:CDS:2 [Dentiscutata erythropus]|uniref:9933_t:CDS:1 n=1 Tax=Dentiscutata erythropus TaxID=1348616 RepID=A0A9N8Z4F0_9GLOM|nr:9933_t:CDS:2 [Dentiscutata erythropus]
MKTDIEKIRAGGVAGCIDEILTNIYFFHAVDLLYYRPNYSSRIIVAEL